MDFTRKSLAGRVINYSALAAAGLLVEPATAGTVYSGPGFTPITVASGQTKPVDFGAPFGSVFQFKNQFASITTTTPHIIGYSVVINPGPAGFPKTQLGVVFPGSGNNPKRLAGGYLVNGGASWLTYVGTNTTQDIAGNTGYWNGTANVPVRGYLGFRIFAGGTSFNYGYFDLSYDNSPNQKYGTLTILGWGLETTPDVGITTGPTGAVPEPATVAGMGLGLLALGAAGIRRKRVAATQKN